MVIDAETGSWKPHRVVGDDASCQNAEPRHDRAAEALPGPWPGDGRRPGQTPDHETEGQVQDELSDKEIENFSTDLTDPDTARGRLHHIAAHPGEESGDRLHRTPHQEQEPERKREPQTAP